MLKLVNKYYHKLIISFLWNFIENSWNWEFFIGLSIESYVFSFKSLFFIIIIYLRYFFIHPSFKSSLVSLEIFLALFDVYRLVSFFIHIVFLFTSFFLTFYFCNVRFLLIDFIEVVLRNLIQSLSLYFSSSYLFFLIFDHLKSKVFLFVNLN